MQFTRCKESFYLLLGSVTLLLPVDYHSVNILVAVYPPSYRLAVSYYVRYVRPTKYSRPPLLVFLNTFTSDTSVLSSFSHFLFLLSILFQALYSHLHILSINSVIELSNMFVTSNRVIKAPDYSTSFHNCQS